MRKIISFLENKEFLFKLLLKDINKTKFKQIFFFQINCIIVLLTIILISSNLSIFRESLITASTTFLLIGLVLFNIPYNLMYETLFIKKIKNVSSGQLIFGWMLILSSFIIIFVTKHKMLWISSIPLILSGLNMVMMNLKIRKKELDILLFTSFIYALLFIIVQTIPIFWIFLQKFSLNYSKMIGFIVSRSMYFGPSMTGLWIVSLFAIFFLTLYLFGYLKLKKFLYRLIHIFVIWTIYLIFLDFMQFGSENILNLNYILFIVLIFYIFIHLSKTEKADETLKIFKNPIFNRDKIRKKSVWLLLMLILSMVVLTIFPNGDLNSEEKKETILFYGQAINSTWDAPEYGKYGRNAYGFFGLLPTYMKFSGYNVEILVENISKRDENKNPIDDIKMKIVKQTCSIDNSIFSLNSKTIGHNVLCNFPSDITIIESKEITADLLKNIDVFVVINPKKQFTDSEHRIIWSYIKNGGSILVIGDHTNLKGIQKPLNNLLRPVNIKYRFDSALPTNKNFNWIPCYHLMPSPVTQNIESLDEIQIGIGASLDISFDSFPVVIGKYSLSDAGNHSRIDEAYTGDFEYNPGEQIGDVILVAAAYYGNGKVMVFGDSTPFSNLAMSSSIDFANMVFNWLSSSDTGAIRYVQILISLVLLFTSMISLKFLTDKVDLRNLPVFLCVGLIMSMSINSVCSVEDEIGGSIAYIDWSHNERFNLDKFKNNSLTGTMLNLARNKFLPIILRDFSEERIMNSDIFLLNAPTQILKSDEISILKNFMRNGGLVILATGYEDRDASLNFLKEFGLDIYNTPLGPVPYIEKNPEIYQLEPRFMDSWSIKIEGKYPCESFYNFTHLGKKYHLVTFTTVEKGGLLLISDSQFLYDKNIESVNNCWTGNIQFLKNIIETMKEKKVLQ